MPKFDCMKSWSRVGPRLRLYTCQERLFGIAPMPVRSTSPFARTTSMPQ